MVPYCSLIRVKKKQGQHDNLLEQTSSIGWIDNERRPSTFDVKSIEEPSTFHVHFVVEMKRLLRGIDGKHLEIFGGRKQIIGRNPQSKAFANECFCVIGERTKQQHDLDFSTDFFYIVCP